MRKILSLAAVLALAACGGGGGGSTTPTTPAQPPAQPQPPSAPAGYVTPQFTLRIPARGSSAKGKSPQYISSATASVVITLTADSNGVDTTTIGGNPATTTIAAGACNPSCVVNGPPSPPGTDSFRIVTYDNSVPASGHALNAAQLNNVAITAGQNNPESVVLGAIPATLALSNAPTNVFNAGTQNQTDFVSVIAKDAAGVTIPTSQSPAVTYVDATGAPLVITISDPDTTAYGTCVESGAGTTQCTSGAATSVTLNGPDAGATVHYDGLAENPVTLKASAPGTNTDTASIQPNLNAPAFNSAAATPSGVALTGSAEIDLFATSATGSTGTESFTEHGWTDSPYNQALISTAGTCTAGTGLATSLSQIATLSAGTNSTTNGTPFTATVVASPLPGSCTATIGDGLTANTTDGSATLTVTYTTSTITGSSKRRQ